MLSDLKILYHLAMKPIRGKDHAARMESFYAGQAEAYDNFRKRLLHGREQLWESIPTPPGGVWVDMGGGTGSNLEFLGDRIEQLGELAIFAPGGVESAASFTRSTPAWTPDLRRHERELLETNEFVAERGATRISISDSELSPLTRGTDASLSAHLAFAIGEEWQD